MFLITSILFILKNINVYTNIFKIEYLILKLKLKIFRMLTKYGIIDNCVKIASNYDGKVFGGYLRDVVPKMQDPLRKCQFKHNNK